MRDGYTRAREIEEAATSLVDWCDEFVRDVLDHRGGHIYPDWDDLMGALREALKPLPAVERLHECSMEEVGRR